MSGFVLEEFYDDERDTDDTCHHGVGFDEFCEDCEDEDEQEARAALAATQPKETTK